MSEVRGYRVENLQGNTYQVFRVLHDYLQDDDLLAEAYRDPVFQGSLADCEAYIRLKQNKNVEF